MNVPALRFSEFGREWEEKRLGAIAQFSKGKGISKADVVESGMTPCVRYGELYTTYGRQIETVISFTNGPESELFLSAGGEILIPASGETAYDIATATVLPHSNVAIGGDLNIVKTAEDGFFIASYLSGKRKRHLARMAQGNSVVHLYKEQIASTSLHLPTLPEQKKIAAFLGAVDARIAGARKRRDLLETYKRGLMQALFSRTLRFTRDDGTPFPDWEGKRLGDVFDWVKTNSLSREFLSNEEGDVQNIHYGDIHKKFRPLFRQHAEQVPYVANGSSLAPFSDEEYCKQGDVVIADASEDYADIGKAIEIVQVRENTLVAGLHTYIARPKSGKTVVGFSGYLMRSAPVRRQIMRIAQGISVLGISKTNLSKLDLHLPHPDEQQKIANALSAIDAKIDTVTGQIAWLEAFKKGLLQQMFI